MPEPTISKIAAKTAPSLVEISILTSPPDAPPAAEIAGTDKSAQPEPTHAKPRRKKSGGPAYLQVDELERLFRAIDEPRDRAIFRLAYHAGLRASEVGLLKVRDFQPRTDRIFVERLKGSNSGEHHLCREEARALRAWLKIRGDEPGAIFLSRKGKPISRQMLDVLMREYGKRAKIPAQLRHFHVLKHTCATHLLSKGFNVEQVQDWIGHANIQNTMIYAKITNRRRDEMGEKLKNW
jgi:integrase